MYCVNYMIENQIFFFIWIQNDQRQLVKYTNVRKCLGLCMIIEVLDVDIFTFDSGNNGSLFHTCHVWILKVRGTQLYDLRRKLREIQRNPILQFFFSFGWKRNQSLSFQIFQNLQRVFPKHIASISKHFNFMITVQHVKINIKIFFLKKTISKKFKLQNLQIKPHELRMYIKSSRIVPTLSNGIFFI